MERVKVEIQFSHETIGNIEYLEKKIKRNRADVIAFAVKVLRTLSENESAGFKVCAQNGEIIKDFSRINS